MNSAVITKIEYRVFPETEFTVMDIIPHSGKLTEQLLTDGGGNSYDVAVNFTVAKSEDAKDTVLKSVATRKSQCRVTDANGSIYLIGTDSYPARLTYSRNIDGQPGSFNGYRCLFSHKSPTGATVS